MTDRGRQSRANRTRMFVITLVCMEFVAQILSFFMVSGLGTVKGPCVGISCESPATGGDSPDLGSYYELVLDQVLAAIPDDGAPDRVENDFDQVLMAFALNVRGRVADLLCVPAAFAPDLTVLEAEGFRAAPQPLTAPAPVAISTRLCRLTC